jgi:hypothetical protein
MDTCSTLEEPGSVGWKDVNGDRLRTTPCEFSRPHMKLDVNFQEVVHSDLAGNADVTKPQ